MNIFSKTRLRFDRPGTGGLAYGASKRESVEVKPKELATVPEWVRESDMFKLAVKDGTVSEITTAAQATMAEANGQDNVKTPPAGKADTPEADPTAASKTKPKAAS